MNHVIDVLDYLRRLVAAVFLYPVAVAFWVLFGMAGFSPTKLFILCGKLGQSFAAMAPDDQGTLVLQFLGSWGILAFLFLLMTFAFEPPKFYYDLRRKGHHHEVGISP
jgi:hypothetical protein